MLGPLKALDTILHDFISIELISICQYKNTMLKKNKNIKYLEFDLII